MSYNTVAHVDLGNGWTGIGNGASCPSSWCEQWREFYQEGIKYDTDNKTGRQQQIVSYNNFYMITIGWLIPRRGSIFNLFEQLVIISALIVLVTILGASGCDVVNKGRATRTTSCITYPQPSTQYLTLLTLSGNDDSYEVWVTVT
jgi:hypothetical protein